MDSLQQILPYLQLVIIDEMSMVGADRLYQVNKRLKEIKSNNKQDFGGVAGLLLGDLMQLQPVKARWIYKEPKDTKWKHEYHCTEEGLWGEFRPYILHENHRQGDDKEYADVLNRLRYGNHTEEDIAKIKTMVVDNFPGDVP